MAAKLARLSGTTAPNGRELYHSQFSLQAVSSETSGYMLIHFSTRYDMVPVVTF